jgi:hypothetical protein
MITQRWIEKDVQGSGRDLLEVFVLHGHFLRRLRKHTRNRLVSLSVEIGLEQPRIQMHQHARRVSATLLSSYLRIQK